MENLNTEDVKLDTVEEITAEEVNNSDTTQDNNSEVDKPYKTFNTQDEYDKFIKSESMKRVAELYKELGVNSKEELKAYRDSATEYNTLRESYDTLNTSNGELQDKFNELSKNYTDLENELLITQFGINKDNANDFLILAKSKVSDTVDLKKACEETVTAYPYFKENIVRDIFKIGSPKSEVIEREMTSDEMAQLRQYFNLKK